MRPIFFESDRRKRRVLVLWASRRYVQICGGVTLDSYPGVSLADVSVLLGHQLLRVTEKHYSPWVKARQKQLEATVRVAQQRYNSDTSANQHQ
jgi:hypothetical protein